MIISLAYWASLNEEDCLQYIIRVNHSLVDSYAVNFLF